MVTVRLNHVDYHYIDEGEGEALLLLHGFTGRNASWQAIIAHFRQNYRVIRPDLLGHGETATPDDPERYAMHHAAADLIALLDTLNITKAHLLGYSMGGRLALYTALSHPDRITSLILESASPGLRTQERDARRASDNELADKIEANGLEWFVDFWERLPLWASQAQLDDHTRQQLHASRLRNNPQGLANSLRGMGTGVMPSLWAQLADLALPTQLIVGALDTKFVSINQTMLEGLPNAQIDLVADAGHTVHLEQPTAYATLLANFLTIVARGGP